VKRWCCWRFDANGDSGQNYYAAYTADEAAAVYVTRGKARHSEVVIVVEVDVENRIIGRPQMFRPILNPVVEEVPFA
jgi:hypothetical protein